MRYRETVTRVVKDMGLLEPTGALAPLDSLTIVDLVIELENALGCEIPIADLKHETFISIDSIATMLAELE